MVKFINILDSVINEQKRHKFDPQTYVLIGSVVERLWADRNKPYKGITPIENVPIQTKDGTYGNVQIRVNPRLKYIGFMGTKPKDSRDPMDIFIDVNPKFYESKKNLYLTIYHELMHAIDPTQTTKFSPKYMTTYDEKSEKNYWGHPIEFFAITNEFLEGLVNEFVRRIERHKTSEQFRNLRRMLDNIMAYFAKNKPLTKQSLNLLQRINDDSIGGGKFSDILANIQTDYPETSDIIPPSFEDEPYYLHYVQMIKKFNPKIWPRFLTMLYKTKLEIENVMNEKGV